MWPIRLYVAMGIIVRYWLFRTLIALGLALIAFQLPYGRWLMVLPLGWFIGLLGRAIARTDSEVSWLQAVLVGVLSVLLAPLIGFPLAALASVTQGETVIAVFAIAYSLLPLTIVVTICRLHVSSQYGRFRDPFQYHRAIGEWLRNRLRRV